MNLIENEASSRSTVSTLKQLYRKRSSISSPVHLPYINLLTEIDCPTNLHALLVQVSRPVFPDTFDSASAAAIWQMDNDAAVDSLGELISFRLVDYNETTERYRLLDLARVFAN